MNTNGKCELCGIEAKLTKHHLVPQHLSRSAKYSKDLKHDESNFLWICEECHKAIHAAYTDYELRDMYNTREALSEAEEVKKFVDWRKKHPDFKGSSKMSNRRKR